MGESAAASSGEFATGDTHGDPVGSSDNSGWNTSHYPTSDAGNKTAGVRFDVATSGYENISIAWCQRNSATASRYLRLQFTLDGVTFIDADTITVDVESVFTNKIVDLSTIPGVADNPYFGFQIVTEFESTALGWGADAYAATKDGSSYSSSGTVRYDMVTVSGTPIPGANTPPTLSVISNQTIRVGHSTEALYLAVGDAEDSPENLAVWWESSDPAIIPEGGILVSGTGADRTVIVTASDQPGFSIITLNVMDTGGRSTAMTFTVTVLPENTAPTISSLSRTNTLTGVSTPPLALFIQDLETLPGDLSLSGKSANPDLVPNSGITFAGTGSDCTLTVTPAAGRTGVAPITVTVSDGTNAASTDFALQVTATDAVILDDPFRYSDGSLITNSARFWGTRSGTVGQAQVSNGRLQVTSDQTEDVVASLVGGPYAKGNGIRLYASFKATFLTLPESAPGLFASFADGSTLRGRIYAGTTNSAPGFFRLSTANGAAWPQEFPLDLNVGTPYTVVECYDLDTALTTLWLDPASEFDSSVMAWDTQPPVPILSYGFRQDNELGGTVMIDDLKVGFSFDAVVSATTPVAIPLELSFDGSNLVLSWIDPAFILQSAPSPSAPFVDVPGASSPFIEGAGSSARFFRLRSATGSP